MQGLIWLIVWLVGWVGNGHTVQVAQDQIVVLNFGWILDAWKIITKKYFSAATLLNTKLESSLVSRLVLGAKL